MDNQYIDDATRRDQSRHDATATDTDFTLSLEEVAERYAQAGHARTLRSLQRYCASGHLDAQKIATTTGDKNLVTPQSVARHNAQIKEFAALEAVVPFRDLSRPVAPAVAPQILVNSAPPAAPEAATGPDTPRQVATPVAPEAPTQEARPVEQDVPTSSQPRQDATEPAATGEPSRYVVQLERQLEVARDERDFLREQINRKDKTIDALIERDRETNYLVRGLQEMLTPLLGGGRHEPPAAHPMQ